MIKNYSKYLNENILALPPHLPEVNEGKLVYTIHQIYEMEHRDIIMLSNRINSIIESGTYIKIRNIKHNIYLTFENEPLLIFGMKGGNSFTKSIYSNIECKNDSIVVYFKSNDSLFIIDSNSFKDYEIIFIRPKRIISKQDPYGEEDWSEE